MFKLLVIILFGFIVFNLAMGLVHMMKSPESQRQGNMARSLTWRVALSILLFILLFGASKWGLIQPHGIDFVPHNTSQ